MSVIPEAPPEIESYVCGDRILIRPFLDHTYWNEDWHRALLRYFRPGYFHMFVSAPGTEKTDMMVSLMQNLLDPKLSPETNWRFLTNLFFTYTDENGSRTAYPKGITHFHTLRWALETIGRLKAEGNEVCLVIDDLQESYTEFEERKKKQDRLSETIRYLVNSRKKLGIMVWLASDRDYTEFDDYPNRRCSSDVLWRFDYGSSNDTAKAAKVSFPARNYWFSSGLTNADLLLTPTSWTKSPSEKKKGFFIDRTGAAPVKEGENFDGIGMCRELATVSSLDAWSVVGRYLESSKIRTTAASKPGRDAEIALRLKNIGLTDEAIEWVLSVPKTTLRRHVEKNGEVWGVSQHQPFLFKKVKASERRTFLEEAGQTNDGHADENLSTTEK